MEISDLETARQGALADLTIETIPARDAVVKHQKLVLLGKPGAGQTTFLQHLALECIKGHFQGDRIPVAIFLRTFVVQGKAAQDFS